MEGSEQEIQEHSDVDEGPMDTNNTTAGSPSGSEDDEVDMEQFEQFQTMMFGSFMQMMMQHAPENIAPHAGNRCSPKTECYAFMEMADRIDKELCLAETLIRVPDWTHRAFTEFEGIRLQAAFRSFPHFIQLLLDPHLQKHDSKTEKRLKKQLTKKDAEIGRLRKQLDLMTSNSHSVRSEDELDTDAEEEEVEMAELVSQLMQAQEAHEAHDSLPSAQNEVLPIVPKRPTMRTCASCNKTMLQKQLKRCGSCKVAWFCNRACQKEANKEHKAVCMALCEGRRGRVLKGLGREVYALGKNYKRLSHDASVDLENAQAYSALVNLLVILGLCAGTAASDCERQRQEVVLNVGGEIFHTSLSILTKEPHSMLAVMFSGRFDTSVSADDDGRIMFLDRDPQAFGSLLNWLRSGVLPAEEAARVELFYEADYFLIDKLQQLLQDQVLVESNAQLSPGLQQQRAEESAIRTLFATEPQHPDLADPHLHLVDLFKAYSADPTSFVMTQDACEQAQLPLLFEQHRAREFKEGKCCVCPSLTTFKDQFTHFTCGTFGRDFDWRNVIVAGGAVLGAVSPIPRSYSNSDGENHRVLEYYHGLEDIEYMEDEEENPDNFNFNFDYCYYGGSKDGTSRFKGSDIDVFLWGLNREQAIAKIEHIARCLERTNLVGAVRTRSAITFVRQYPFRHVQVVLRLYKSPAEVLSGFDVDCCSICWDGHRVYALPRAIAAIKSLVNIADGSRQSPTYESRLHKYARRGYAVAVPGMKRSEIDPQIYVKPFAETAGLARLLILEHADIKSNASARDHHGFFTARGSTMSPAGEEVDEYNGQTGVLVPYRPYDGYNPLDDLERELQVLAWKNNDFSKPLTFFMSRHGPQMMEMLKDIKDHCTINNNIYDDPGRQQIGSFHPLGGDWERTAYRAKVLVSFEPGTGASSESLVEDSDC